VLGVRLRPGRGLLFATGFGNELYGYPFGPFFNPGQKITYITFLDQQRSTSVDHYEAECQPKPEDAV